MQTFKLRYLLIFLFVILTAISGAVLWIRNTSLHSLPDKALFNKTLSNKISSKTIFLTFDADMTRYMKKKQELGFVKQWYSPELIEYLEKNDIPATFL